MEYKRFENTVVLRIDRGEEITSALKKVSEKENIKLASVSAIGAVDRFTVGLYSVGEKQYKKNTFTGDFEIVSLSGNINTMDGEYYSHLHMSAARSDGSVAGGHLNEAFVSATCEMFITILDGKVDRFHDEITGLNLFKF